MSFLNGLPFRGSKEQLVKVTDPEELQPKQQGSIKTRVFRLDSPETIKEFDQIMTAVHNKQLLGQAVVLKLDYQYTNNEWAVLLTWVEYFMVGAEDAMKELDKEI